MTAFVVRYRKFGVFLVVLMVMLTLDQVTKEWVRSAIPPHGSWRGGWPLPGVFELTLTYNQGIAFGLFKGLATLMTPIAVAIAGGSTWYSLRHPKDILLSHIAMGLLAAGALGNLNDRLLDPNGVTDMFWFRTIDFPVFNVADSCITVATFLLIATWWIDAARISRNRPPEIEPLAPMEPLSPPEEASDPERIREIETSRPEPK